MSRSSRGIHERQLAYAPEHHTSYTAKGRIVEGSDVLVKMAGVGLMASGGAGYIGGRAMVKPIATRMTRGRFSEAGAAIAIKTIEKAQIKRAYGGAKFLIGSGVAIGHKIRNR